MGRAVDNPASAPLQADPAAVRILLVDDMPQNLLALEAMLGDLSLDLVRAESGAEALRQVLQDDFAVILLDVLMSGLDGLETATLIRARERSRDTPIIFITAAGGDEDLIARGYALGAVDYIVKPIHPAILRSKVAVFVELFRKTAQLARRTADLTTANKELEAFSYSVSHDLRSPLRAMDGFARILLEEHAPQLPPDAQRYLHLVRDNAQQMGRLVDDLLAFSRLGRQPLATQRVAPSALVHEVLAELRPDQEGRCVDVVLDDLPACQADPALLKQVFVNLLANALKFTAHRDVARITVGRCEQGGEPVYFVRDNGVGFDMRYAHKLFGVFQRLHRAEDYTGTGVGLAIAQRIIHRHGGRIWANAETDRGATFYFTLQGEPPHA